MRYLEKASCVSIGQRLRKKRKELKMTQKALAAAIGVTFQQLQKYETGQTNISINMLMKLCEELKVNINYFIPSSNRMYLSDNIVEDSETNIDDIRSEELEKKLTNMFNSINDKKVKLSILALVEVIINTK